MDYEIKGIGNNYDFGARMLDPRVGRWFSPDKMEVKYPNISTYVSFANSPIYYVDSDGNEFVNAYKKAYFKSKLDVENARKRYEALFK